MIGQKPPFSLLFFVMQILHIELEITKQYIKLDDFIEKYYYKTNYSNGLCVL